MKRCVPGGNRGWRLGLELFYILQRGEADDIFEADIGEAAVGFDAGGAAVQDISFLRGVGIVIVVDIDLGEHGAVGGDGFQEADVYPGGAGVQDDFLINEFFQFFFHGVLPVGRGLMAHMHPFSSLAICTVGKFILPRTPWGIRGGICYKLSGQR